MQSIIRRISEVVSEFGYEEFAEMVLANGGQFGANSMIGNIGPINLIPSEGEGVCCPLVMGVAQGRSASRRNGFPEIMRQLRAHLIRCSCRTNLVVILTDSWDPKLIGESKLDLIAHRELGVKVITLLASGNTITHIPMNF